MASHKQTSRTPGQIPGMMRLTAFRPDSTALSVVGIVVVLAFGFLISKTNAMTHLDLEGDKALNTLHTGWLGKLGADVYRIFSPVEAVALTFVIVLVIWALSRNLRLAATFAVTIAVTWLISDVVKDLVHRARPDRSALLHPLAERPLDASYPSGHMVFVATLAIAFFFLARGKSYRPLVAVIGAFGIVIVAFCLVSDGVHYPSDVTASVIWSFAVAPLVLTLWNRVVLPRTYRSPASAGSGAPAT